MAREVDEDVGARVGEEAFGAREGGVGRAAREEAQEVGDGDVVAAVVDFDGGGVEVEGAGGGGGEDAGGEVVAGGAGDVVGEHEDDVGVWDAEAFDGAVPGCSSSLAYSSSCWIGGKDVHPKCIRHMLSQNPKSKPKAIQYH